VSKKNEPIQSVKGTRDLLPAETPLWQRVEDEARKVFETYNFREIRTPVLEQTALFARSVGSDTDIVTKEMYTFEDRDSGSLTLRPEATASVVRAYIEHSLYNEPGIQKLYYFGPMFRRERPQKGRYRQFYQIGAEVLGPPSAGSESPARDAEIIAMLAHLLREVGIKEWTLQLNSVGCADDRARYNQALREALAGVKDKMCVDCQRRAETNPLRVLDCKVPEDQPIIESLPKISAYLDEPCREHFNEVKKILNHVGIRYQVNERMVRGLDYYTRTTFEFTHGGLGAQSALLGGGRYDGLSEALGGPKAPGIGFALGLDRFVLALQAEETVGIPDVAPRVYIAPLGLGMNAEAAVIARDLRKQQIAAELGDDTFKVKKSFEAAERSGAKFILFVGENEIASGQFSLKNLKSGEQMSVAREEIGLKLKASF
jgi:histidyl-tRNA synthetase